MKIQSSICILVYISLLTLLHSYTALAGVRSVGKIYPGFQGSQVNWIDNSGLFLLSRNMRYAFGFTTSSDVSMYLLVVIHTNTSRVIWTANRGSPVENFDKLVFNRNGNVYLQKGDKSIWSTNTADKGVAYMELRDSGNMVLLGNDSKVIWQSFSHPTDTLISEQDLTEGMKLISNPSSNGLTYSLEIKSGDMILSAGYQTPQPYWSMGREKRRIINKYGVITQASLEANSWRFYDKKRVLIWQFVFSDYTDQNVTWAAVLGKDGVISFYNLPDGGPSEAAPAKLPGESCGTPEPCDAYNVCYSNGKCQCPSVLQGHPNCKPGNVSQCNHRESQVLVNAGDSIDYFAIGFLPPSSKTNLKGCKASCLSNCSCVALFFQNSTGYCLLLDRIGSFKDAGNNTGYVSYIKVLSDGKGKHGDNHRRLTLFVAIAVSTVSLILGLLLAGLRFYREKLSPESAYESSEGDNFLDTLTGMPHRFTYKELQAATNNFASKLGHGGFGSVYEGVLPDGTRMAVKKLESIGQGTKEFRAEVSIIGSIHHIHLVRLKGFCAEGSYRLLAYEYMANGSLEKWIFKKNNEDFLLDWDTRYNIALGTAKGLAYLHEDCDVKIVHCDIKPENVLLDENFQAKVSDFGLAKLMTREQSHVFTTMRGTRGYLAPEWITSYAISEKSDVYSYGMLLLEIIGGRKNFDPNEISEKSHFPTYAFKMLEEGKLQSILDSRLNMDDQDERVLIAIKVALWCIQEDMHSRPSMSNVVQMLEGLSDVPPVPASSQLGSRLYSSFLKSISEEGTCSGSSECNSGAYVSAIRLSGPR